MTASKTFPRLGGRCNEGDAVCDNALNAKLGEHGNYGGTGSCNNIPNRPCLNKVIDTSITYVAGAQDYPNFFTCSYHFNGGRGFDGCMSGSAQSRQLTFALTYVDDGSFQPRNRHGQGDYVQIFWNRCSSLGDCLSRWPNAGEGIDGLTSLRSVSQRATGYAHQMGWSNPNDRSTQTCWGKYKGTGDMSFGRIWGCKYWHYSSFSGAPINKGRVSTMNNAGSSGIHDSLMVNPARVATKYWSSTGHSGAPAGNGNLGIGGLDIDMLYRDYGPGWYIATIGGFGCEIDTDTTWFRIKSSECGIGTYCTGGNSAKTLKDVYGRSYTIASCLPSGTATGQACRACPVGTYADVVNLGACKQCAAGKKGNGLTKQTSVSSCLPCIAGKGSAKGAASCTACPSGQYSTTGSACSPCSVGKASADFSASPFFYGNMNLYVGISNGEIWFYKRSGSSFTRQTTTNNPLYSVYNIYIKPANDGNMAAKPFFDGNMNLYVGNYDGAIWYYKNTGSTANPSLTRQTGAANPLNDVDVGNNASPFFVDDDNDGDMDLYAGNYAGEIWYYKNIGSKTNPSFTRQTGAANPLNGVDVGSYASPSFVDDDIDGDMDMYVGNREGAIRYYKNIGSKTNPSFTHQTGAANPLNGVDVGAATKCFKCPGGYSCPLRTASYGSDGPVPCGSGKFYCPRGDQQSPIAVDAGHYGANPAIPGSINTFQQQSKCKPGYTCDGGLSSLTIPGYYSTVGMAANAAIPCVAGHFCDYGSKSNVGLTVHTERLVITAFTPKASSNVGMFTHDEWPRGVVIKAGRNVDVTGFTDPKLNKKFTVLGSPAPTRTTFHVSISTPPSAVTGCGHCEGIHNGYEHACIHYGSDGKTATNEWVESAFGERCNASPVGLPRYGIGHESPEACKVTCNSVIACVGFTWHEGVALHFDKIWDGGCEYICNADTTSGICKPGDLTFGSNTARKGQVPGGGQKQFCTRTSSSSALTTAAANKKCFSKPCARDTISAKDCSWYCLGGGAWSKRHIGETAGCSSYLTKNDCEGTNKNQNTECLWLTSVSDPTRGSRCTDRHDKPMRVMSALSYTTPVEPYSTCYTRQLKENCPADRLCSGGLIGDRLEFTPAKVRITEIEVTNNGKSAKIQRELIRGQTPVFEENDKIDISGFGNDIDGRWKVASGSYNTDYLSPVNLFRTEVATSPTINSLTCPPTGPGCEMRLVDDRGQLPICTDGSSNGARSHRYLRESAQAINSYSDGLIMNIRDYKCDTNGNCQFDYSRNPPSYPAGVTGVVLDKSKITITKQRCAPGYGEDRKDYNYGNPLFQVYDNRGDTTDPAKWKNWIGTTDFTLATLHGYFTPPNPNPNVAPQMGIHTYCLRWDLELEVVGYGTELTKQLCALTVEVLNENDPPQFIAKQMVTRIFPEKSPPGTVIDIKDNKGSLGDQIGGLASEDSDAPNGKGQNNFFKLRQVNHPALPGCSGPYGSDPSDSTKPLGQLGGCKTVDMNLNEEICTTSGCGCSWDPQQVVGAQCNWHGKYDWTDSFAVSECDGSIIVNKAVERTYHREVWLCVDVCDDANFFPPDVGGDGKTPAKCTPSVPTDPIKCPSLYSKGGGVGGQLVVLTVKDRNDAPYFYDSTICTSTNPCKVRENAVAGDRVYWPGLLPCEKNYQGVRKAFGTCTADGDKPSNDFYGADYNGCASNSFSGFNNEGKCSVADVNYLVNEPDNNPMKYFLTQQSTDKPSDKLFEIDSKGVIRVMAGAKLDFEAANGQPTYTITIKVIDQMDAITSCPDNYDKSEKSCYAEKVLTIEVVDGNDPPTWPTMGTIAQVPEDATFHTLLTGTTANPFSQPFMAEDEDTLDQSSLQYSTTSDKFELLKVGTQVEIRVKCPRCDTCLISDTNCPPLLDYETQTSHIVTVTVSDVDRDGLVKSTTSLAFTVNVLDVNEPLELCAGVTANTVTSKTYTLKNSTRCTGTKAGSVIHDGGLSAAIIKISKGKLDTNGALFDECKMYGDQLPARAVWTFTLKDAVHITEAQGVSVTQSSGAATATGLLTFALPAASGTKTSKIIVTSAVDQHFDTSSNLLLNGGSTLVAPVNLVTCGKQIETVVDVTNAPSIADFPPKSMPTYTIKVKEDSLVGTVVARKADFLIFDVDVPRVQHIFDLKNPTLPSERTAVESMKPSGYVVSYDSSQHYRINKITGDITVARALDSDGGASMGEQTLVLTVTEPDGSHSIEALVDFKLIDVNEPPLAREMTQFFCVEEMVGNSFEKCADKTSMQDGSLQYSSETDSSAACLHIYSKPAGGSCPEAGMKGQASTFAVVDPENNDIEFKTYRPRFSVMRNTGTLGMNYGMLEWSPGKMIDYEDPDVGGTFKVRIDFGDALHPYASNFIASIEIIDRNDPPRWGDDMPLLVGGPKDTSPTTISYPWKFLSPNYDLSSFTPNTPIKLTHHEVSKTATINRYQTGPLNCPKHAYMDNEKLDTGIQDIYELRRGGMKIGNVAGKDDDCQTSSGPCSPTDFGEIHFTLAKNRPGEIDSTKKKFWPQVYPCEDSRRTSDATTCAPTDSGTGNCWAYSRVTECGTISNPKPCETDPTGSDCKKCKANTAYCTKWADSPISNFYPFTIDELTGAVTVNMICPQDTDGRHDSPADQTDSKCTSEPYSLYKANSMFRVYVRVEDRGAGRPLADNPSSCSTSPKSTLAEKECNLWAEGYFEVLVTPTNEAPVVAGLVELDIPGAPSKADHGYPHGSEEPWWEKKGADVKAKYIKPDIEIQEYDAMYEEGARQSFWSREVVVSDPESHTPLTCSLVSVSPTCADLGVPTGQISNLPCTTKPCPCRDVPTHFEVFANNTGPNSTCVFRLASTLDYENLLFASDKNDDSSVTVIFVVTDAKGRQSKKMGQKFIVKNVNEAPSIKLDKIEIFEGYIGELTSESPTNTRFGATVLDHDAGDSKDSIKYKLNDAFYEKDETKTERISLEDYFELDTGYPGKLTLKKPFDYALGCHECLGKMSPAVVVVKIAAYDTGGKYSSGSKGLNSLAVKVHVKNLNEKPTIGDLVVTVREDSKINALVTYIRINDPDGILATKGSFTILEAKDEFQNNRKKLFEIDTNGVSKRVCNSGWHQKLMTFYQGNDPSTSHLRCKEPLPRNVALPAWCDAIVKKLDIFNTLGRNQTGESALYECTDNCLVQAIPNQPTKATWQNVMAELNANKGNEVNFFHSLFDEYTIKDQLGRSFVKKSSTIRPKEVTVDELDYYIDPSLWQPLVTLCPDCLSNGCSDSECVWRELNLTKAQDLNLPKGSVIVSRRDKYEKQLDEFLGSADGGPKECHALEAQIVLKEDTSLPKSPDGYLLDFEDIKWYKIKVSFSDGGAQYTSKTSGIGSATLGEEFFVTVNVGNVDDLEISSVVGETQSASGTFATEGGEKVTILGRNFGWSDRQINGDLSTNEWKITITSTPITQNAGVTVTQGSKSGILKTALTGDTTEIIVTANVGVLFDAKTTNLIINPGASETIIADSDQNEAVLINRVPASRLVGQEPTQPKLQLLYGVDTSNSETCFAAGTCYEATDCIFIRTGVLGNSKIECKTAPGKGTNHGWRLVLNYGGNPPIIHSSSVKGNTGYNKPLIIALRSASNMKTLANQEIQIIGKHFGPEGPLISSEVVEQQVQYNWKIDKQYESQVTALRNCITTVAHTEISCILKEGSGNSLEWMVKVGGQSSAKWVSDDVTENEWRISIHSASITQNAGVAVTQGSNSGTLKTALSGSGIIEVAITAPVSEMFTHSVTDIIIGDSNNNYTISAADQTNAMLIQGQSSFAAPIITGVEGVDSTNLQQLHTVGNQLVKIKGLNFGPRSSFRRVTYSAGVQKVGGSEIVGKVYKCSDCGNDCRISDPDKVHSEIICRTEPGIGKNLQFSVEVGPALEDPLLGVDGGIKA